MVPLGLIPGGTGNSVLKTLNLDPSNWKLAAEAIVDVGAREASSLAGSDVTAVCCVCRASCYLLT